MSKDKTRHCWFLLLISVAVTCTVIVAAKFAVSQRHPTYCTIPIRAWLSAYGPGCRLPYEIIQHRKTAMLALGTNAVPYILGELRCHDSRFKSKLMECWSEYEFIQWGATVLHYWPLADCCRRSRAEDAFADLKLEQEVAIPLLMSLLDEHVAVEVQAFSARELGKIGIAASNALPALVHAVETTTNFSLRDCATEALAKIDRQRALQALLEKWSQITNHNCYIALAVARLNPQQATGAGMASALIHSLKDPDRIFVGDCAHALGKLKVLDAVPALIATLPHVSDHAYATEQVIAALALFGTNASVAAPGFLTVLDNR